MAEMRQAGMQQARRTGDVGGLTMGAAWAKVGVAVGLCIAATEVMRYTVLWQVGSLSGLSRSASVLVYFTIGFLVFITLLRRGVSLSECKPLIAVLAIMSVLGVALKTYAALAATTLGEPLELLAILGMETPYFLMVVYVDFLRRFRLRDVMRVVSMGIVIAGAFEMLVSLLSAQPVSYLIVSLAAPAACLMLVHLRTCIWDGSEVALQANADASRPVTRAAERSTTVPLIAFTLSMVAITSMIVYVIHYQWLAIQDSGGTSLLVQLCAGVGMLIAGGILLLSVRYLDERNMPSFCFILIVPTAVIAMYVASIAQGAELAIVTVPLNIVYATLLFFVWMFAWSFMLGADPLYSSLAAFYVKRAGVLLGPLVVSAIAAVGGSLEWFVLILLSVLIICGVVHYMLLQLQVRQEMSEFETSQAIPTKDSESVWPRVMESICEDYGLTPSEADVLNLLGRGRTAKYVASALKRSEATIKTHTMHIYRKLGINSQQQLLDLIEKRIDRPNSSS